MTALWVKSGVLSNFLGSPAVPRKADATGGFPVGHPPAHFAARGLRLSDLRIAHAMRVGVTGVSE